MARSNGGNGGSYFDLNIEVMSTSEAAYTLRAAAYLTSLNVSDSTNTFAVSGNWSRSGSLTLNGVYSGTLVWSQDITVTRQVGSAVNVSVSASWSNVEYWGTTLSASESYSVPARPYVVPTAPSGVSVARVSNTEHRVSWTLNASSSAPVTERRVYRSTDGGSWELRAVLSGTFTSNASQSWSDTTTSTGHSYAWRVEAINSSGSAATASSVIYTFVPTAPSGVSVARVSDTQHTVSWTLNASTSAPVTERRAQRSADGAAWATVATFSGTFTANASQSWSDTTTSADHSYAYRMVAYNKYGYAASAATSTVYTTPLAPGTPSAAKSGADIVLSFTNTARYDVGIKVYASQNGGAFALLATVATANLTSWTHAAPSSTVTWAYKVATYNGSLTSAQSAASNTVQLLAPPNAPTNLAPTTVRDATADVTLTWQHNPVDTTGQTQFEVQHRAAGSGTWTAVPAVTSAVSSWVLTGGTYTNPTTVEWQVRTKGQHATYSPWSATATLPTSTTPTVAISSPADASVVAASTLSVEWTYYDAEGTSQAAWRVDLLDDLGALVESRSGVGAAASATMATTLPDESAWSVRVRVQDGDGLWSVWDEAAFTVAYALPPVPIVTPVWDPQTATVALEIENPDPAEGEATTDHVDVSRSIDDGPWLLIAEAVPPNTTVTDYSPTVAGVNVYRIEAVSSLPSTSQTTVTVTTPQVGDPPGSVWISGGEDLSVVCRAQANPDIEINPGAAETVLHRFEGRDAPVMFESPDDALALSLTTDVFREDVNAGWSSSLAQWEKLATVRGPRLWRDPSGRWVKVAAAIHISRPAGGNASQVSVTATRVEG